MGYGDNEEVKVISECELAGWSEENTTNETPRAARE